MKLYRNIAHLFLWQGSNYLIPLLVTPYLARVLGLHSYGVFGFSLAVAAYGVLITDWGFNLSAAQKVARAANEPARLRAVFWSTMVAKVMLAALALVLFALATLMVPMLRALWPALLASSLIVVSTALSANFFLQGLQYMGSFAIASIIGRISIIPLMLVLVHGPQDVVKAVAIQNGTQLISALVSLVICARMVSLRPAAWSIAAALQEVRDGWHQFVSSFSVSLYTQANAIFVGFNAGQVQAGIFTGSQRISQAFYQLMTPVNMALYPQINRLTHSDPSTAVALMFKALRSQVLFGGALGLVLFALAPYIVPVFLGEAFRPAISIVRVLALLPVLSAVTTCIGGNMLLPLGLKGPFTAALLGAGVINLTLLLLLTRPYGAMGGAVSSVLTEGYLLIAMSWSLYARRTVLEQMRSGRA